MIIDFHTHIFPDNIAEKTIQFLESEGNTKAFTDGTLDGLKKSMKDNDIDISVVLPVVTKPSQFDTVNSFAAAITGKEGIISFGGIHPDTEDYTRKLTKIKELGLKGIKLHPDYQKTYIDDPKMINIIRQAAQLELIVVIHSGLDIGLPDPIHCPPVRTVNMLNQIANENAKIVLAHMGGFDMWDDVERYLVGRNVWLDTSYSLGMIQDEQFVRIIRSHGVSHILFATDSPWGGQKETVEHIKSLGLSYEELESILHKNAESLLRLDT
jgi:predicted TIM-barrel fold metal-dependent hydrolase